MLYNDLPKYIYATITLSNDRPLGKQEILRFFGVNMVRKYSNVYNAMEDDDISTYVDKKLNY